MGINETAGKAALKSKTVLAASANILAVVALHLLGVEIPVEELDSIVSGTSDLIVKGGLLVSQVLVIYGRLRASERLSSLF